eukprot:m.96048 g.96048  ORF g.96048 m.96048 type:complete len:126 (-) comp15041_c0_seq4:1790-2167(-)
MSASRLSRIVLLGTGPSTCVPNLGCLLGLRNNGPCPVCKEAHANPQSRNRRTNPSLLIQYKADEHAEVANIIIDCGKTFRNQIERFFPKVLLPATDCTPTHAILRTHAVVWREELTWCYPDTRPR